MEIPVFWLVNQDKLFSTFILHIGSKISQLNEFGLKMKIFRMTKIIFDVPKIEFQLFQIKHILDTFPLAGFNGFRNLKPTINLTKVYGFYSFIYWYFKILANSQFKILILYEKFIKFELSKMTVGYKTNCNIWSNSWIRLLAGIIVIKHDEHFEFF